MKIRLITTICTIASAMMAAAQVPSLINYQGRLTDASGAPVTGSKNFSLSIYDAATGGNLLYTETIGAVTLDANGVYSFQFGGTGTSNSQVTETLATTDAATLVYTKALANTGIAKNSITVTDGTNTWNQSVGNPGVGATATANTIAGFVISATITNGGSGYTSPPAVTIIGNGSGAAATAVLTEGVVTGITITSAGSGYTGTPTITIAPPVIPFLVDYSDGAITATYSFAPATGRAITATYRYGTNGIADALGGGSQQWMAVSVDGVLQGTRQRVLAVPFAQNAATATNATNAERASIADAIRLEPIVYSVNHYRNLIGSTPTEGTMPYGYYNISHKSANSLGNRMHLIPISIKSISSIDCDSDNTTNSGRDPNALNYIFKGVTELSFCSLNSSGIETIIASQKKDGVSGKISLFGPFDLDHSTRTYYLKINSYITKISDYPSLDSDFNVSARISNILISGHQK